jgi:fluoroacetyl-CoA thioesterase
VKPLAEGMSARDVRLLQGADLCENALSTRVLHLACEMACHNILAPRFDEDDTSVGIRNDIWFWGDAEPGELLHAEAMIARVDGRRVIFNVTARAGTREIARGIHERMLVAKKRFMESLPAPPKP